MINSLDDLKTIRSAPALNGSEREILLKELSFYMNDADWFTVGIMAPSSKLAVFTLKEMESRFNWTEMHLITKPNEDGPVFLKANQKTGEIYVRIEYGLGEGILVGCQYNDENKFANTFGPFPLDFFKIKD